MADSCARVFRTLLPLFALLGPLLGACSGPDAGGGTELPIQVYLLQTDIEGAARVSASELRLWSIEESGGSTTFVSRGVLDDSLGIVTLPNDPGLYLIEAWDDTLSAPPQAPVAVAASAAFRIDSSCLAVLNGTETTAIGLCQDSPDSSLPSFDAADTSSAPSHVAMLKIAGRVAHRIRIVSGSDGTLYTPSEARLWTVVEGDSLRFGGRLRSDGSGRFQLPTRPAGTIQVVEYALSDTSLANQVVTRQILSTGGKDLVAACTDTLSSGDLPDQIDLPACTLGTLLPSSTDSIHEADGMAVFVVLP